MALDNTGCFRFAEQLDPSRLLRNLSGDIIYQCLPPTFTNYLNLNRCVDDQGRRVQTLYRVIKYTKDAPIEVELFIPGTSALDVPPVTASECLAFQLETRVFWRSEEGYDVDNPTLLKLIESPPAENLFNEQHNIYHALAQLKNLKIKSDGTSVRDQLDSLCEQLSFTDFRKSSVLFLSSFEEL